MSVSIYPCQVNQLAFQEGLGRTNGVGSCTVDCAEWPSPGLIVDDYSLFQVPVQRGAADAEDLGDLGLGHAVVAHELCLLDFLRRHFRGPAEMRSLMRLRTRALIQEKTSAGFAAVRTRGRIDAAEARHIQQMIEAGTPKCEIAAVLGIGRATLYRHLAISNG